MERQRWEYCRLVWQDSYVLQDHWYSDWGVWLTTYQQEGATVNCLFHQKLEQHELAYDDRQEARSAADRAYDQTVGVTIANLGLRGWEMVQMNSDAREQGTQREAIFKRPIV